MGWREQGLLGTRVYALPPELSLGASAAPALPTLSPCAIVSLALPTRPPGSSQPVLESALLSPTTHHLLPASSSPSQLARQQPVALWPVPLLGPAACTEVGAVQPVTLHEPLGFSS